MSANKQNLKKMNDQYKKFDELHKNQISFTQGIILIAIVLIVFYFIFRFI